MSRISVYIIAYNESEKIGPAINSVLWADEIVVADSYSKDDTAAIAAEMGARVVQIEFRGFGDLRNRAMDACAHPWIFSLDADERCTPEAQDEILNTIADPGAADAYYIPRRNFFMGRWINIQAFTQTTASRSFSARARWSSRTTPSTRNIRSFPPDRPAT
jgi:glycosyltransferase involved in cell wall biosynthesis